MRLLLLYLAGCRAGDHDLLIDRAYWARRLPLTLTRNGSANEFGRCGRGNGFDACKCYAPSLDTVEALATATLAWTLDASRLAAAIARLQSHCEEAVTVWMPVWGLGGSLIAHLDEYVIPAWARGRAVVLADRPYARGEANSTKFLWAAADDTLPCTTWYGCYWEPLSPCDSRRRLLDDQAPPRVADRLAREGRGAPGPGGTTGAAGAGGGRGRRQRRRGAVWRRSAGRFERRWGGLLFRSAVLEYWWRPTQALRDKIEQGVRAIFKEPTRCVALHVRRGDACRTPWRKCPSLTIALRAARRFSDRYNLPTLFLATDDETVVRDVRATWANKVVWQRSLNRTSYRRRLTEEYWIEARLARGERPSPAPILETLVDVEAAAHCRAFVGGGDAHVAELMLARMVSRLGYVPPFYATAGAFGPRAYGARPSSHTKAGRAVPLEKCGLG
jgi:hypothetical protein